MSAVIGALGLGSMLAVAMETGRAQAGMSDWAQVVSSAAAVEAGALHHWLHEARAQSAFTRPAVGQARLLTRPEARQLAARVPSATWRQLPDGWSVEAVIAVPSRQRPGADGRDDPLPWGLAILRPPTSMPAERGGPTWRLRDLVATRIGEIPPRSTGGAGTEIAALLSSATAFDPDRDIAIWAWRHSGLDRRAILRERRVGHPDGQRMRAHLGMAGGNLSVRTLEPPGVVDARSSSLGMEFLDLVVLGDARSRAFEVSSALGVEIEDARIRNVEADCPDASCVRLQSVEFRQVEVRTLELRGSCQGAWCP